MVQTRKSNRVDRREVTDVSSPTADKAVEEEFEKRMGRHGTWRMTGGTNVVDVGARGRYLYGMGRR